MPSRRKTHSLGRSENRECTWRSTRNIFAVGGGFEAALDRGAHDLVNLPTEQRKLKIARMQTQAHEIRLAQAIEQIFIPDGRGEAAPRGARAVTEGLRGGRAV